ncbi:protein inturned [Anoplophora glabripennis]|uniref:protein inturned n=1 Tax=Anoplophora glabripennis TaxID=217634 RepID=UPI000C77C5C4|nr:protein inturned [Anoplophora glabripennis]
MESQRLLDPRTTNNDIENHSSEEDEWSDGSSYSSYYSDSDSTVPDWEPYVDDFSGELLYIECHPFVTQNNKESKLKKHVEPFSKNQMRRSTRGKFLRLIRRKESKRKSKKGHKHVDLESTTSKVKFQDFQEGEEKEVMLDIDVENRHNLSGDKSLAESLLGLIVSTLSDGNRVMIAGFSYDSKAKHERNIKIGDWLKSINNIEVNVQNLDDILQKFINRDDVLLKLQRVAGIEVTKEPPINELNNESNFVRELLNFKSDDDQLLMQTLCKHPLGIVYIDTEKLNENNQENEDVIYCFPRPFKKNILCNSRGMYITLNHLLNDITQTAPNTSTIKYKDCLAHVVYTPFEKNLLLFMLPDNRASLQEILSINNELIRLLQFSYETVHLCFTNEQYFTQVDHFFSRFFARVLSSGLWATAQQFVELENLSTKSLEVSPCQFESNFSLAATLNLPDEAQMQIDDALAELEASDYREWNEEPLDCQRLFTILGSALYHSGYLLATHFIHEDLIDIHCFCKQHGLFHLSRTEPVKSLVLWREVFPYSCNRIQSPKVKVPEGRRYLLVVGSAKDLLAVIMEAGGCTEPSEDNMGPDAFYVEEAQATLAHIQELGLSELADRFLSMNPGSQISVPIPQGNKKRGDFINLNFSKNSDGAKDSVGSPKKNEVTSILKRRSSDQNFVMQYSSMTSLHDDSYDRQSEESGSQGGYSERSEVSDDSRRNFRRGVKFDSNDEDSETDEFGEGSQMSVGSFDISEIRQNLLCDTEDCRPMQLTAGNDNVLYHFVQLDTTEGILLCPPESKLQTQTYELILNNFRRCCQQIHTLFQNTLRFKNMPAQDMAKSVMNKSLIAIKEHGIIFECPYLDDKETKKYKVSYWVVGRLFYVPHPREMYVCYQDSIPQNLIEIAFKMNMGSMS